MFLLAFFLLLPTILVKSDLLPPPSTGLTGASNYFLQNDGNLIHQVQTKISIKDDFVFSDGGLLFILQVFGPLLDNPAAVEYQGIGLFGEANGTFSFLVETFTVDAFNKSEDLVISKFQTMANLTKNTIPGGTNMTMTEHQQRGSNHVGGV
jgi:hypothetical protein